VRTEEPQGSSGAIWLVALFAAAVVYIAITSVRREQGREHPLARSDDAARRVEETARGDGPGAARAAGGSEPAGGEHSRGDPFAPGDPLAPPARPTAPGSTDRGGSPGLTARELLEGDDDSAARPRFAVNSAGIREGMRTVIPELKACFEPWLAVRPDLRGKVVVRFAVEPDGDLGKVSQITLDESELDQPILETCMLSAIEEIGWERPPGDAPVVVRYPLVLTPSNP
jgi:hypothetical protein